MKYGNWDLSKFRRWDDQSLLKTKKTQKHSQLVYTTEMLTWPEACKFKGFLKPITLFRTKLDKNV